MTEALALFDARTGVIREEPGWLCESNAKAER
jgi:hypothetical protein